MLYIKTPVEAIHLTPITDDNIYTHCKSCGKMFQINNSYSLVLAFQLIKKDPLRSSLTLGEIRFLLSRLLQHIHP